MSEPSLTRADIERLLASLDAELAAEGVEGEIYLVGGAVMCLVLNARPATSGSSSFCIFASSLRAPSTCWP